VEKAGQRPKTVWDHRRYEAMAKLVFGMMQSLDGYVDHLEMPVPGVAVFRHFIDQVRGVAGLLYGRGMYAMSPET